MTPRVSETVSFATTGDPAKSRGFRVPKVCLKIDARNICAYLLICQNHFDGSAGLAGWDGVAAFSLARDSSTRFLKSPLSSCSNPLQFETTCISHTVPFDTRVTWLVRWRAAPVMVT